MLSLVGAVALVVAVAAGALLLGSDDAPSPIASRRDDPALDLLASLPATAETERAYAV